MVLILVLILTMSSFFLQLTESTFKSMDFWAKLGRLKAPYALFAYPFYLVWRFFTKYPKTYRLLKFEIDQSIVANNSMSLLLTCAR